MCKDKSGLVLADEERCIVRWAEYFRELLNPNNPTDRNDQDNDLSLQTAQPFTAEPTLQEVKNEILKLQNFKTTYQENFSSTEVMRYGLNYTSLLCESGNVRRCRRSGELVYCAQYTRKVTNYNVKIIVESLF